MKVISYKNCLEATQADNKIRYLEKIKLMPTVLKNHKEFVRNNKSILKTQHRVKIESGNVFTEEINNVVLSLNDDKIMQSIDLIET